MHPSQSEGDVNHTPEELIAGLAKIRNLDATNRVYLNLGCGVSDEKSVGHSATL